MSCGLDPFCHPLLPRIHCARSCSSVASVFASHKPHAARLLQQQLTNKNYQVLVLQLGTGRLRLQVRGLSPTLSLTRSSTCSSIGPSIICHLRRRFLWWTAHADW